MTIHPGPASVAHGLAAFMGRYAKAHNAGGFAMPTRADIANHPSQFRLDGDPRNPRAVARVVTFTSRSTRHDFTGTGYVIHPGTTVATHVATAPGADLGRVLAGCHMVYAYADDHRVRDWAEAKGWRPGPVRVSAASEIIICWSAHPWAVGLADWQTAAEVPLERRPPIAGLKGEALALTAWTDDFPYYSDGTWSALSLRGFSTDPRWGIKPAEMSKQWKADHPGDLDRECVWTDLAEMMPMTTAWVESQDWITGLERVRLLRMAAAGPQGGVLSRHSDITDRAMGTRDGQIARFHIPVATAPGATMQWWELDGSGHSAHLEEGRCYYLDARKPHAVTNRSGIDRIHLVIDAVVDPEVRRVIADARALP